MKQTLLVLNVKKRDELRFNQNDFDNYQRPATQVYDLAVLERLTR
ncbi:MAG: hypothetical protein AAGG02_20360 [Cyanobacteria bacterium P01_H01_bin.15]